MSNEFHNGKLGVINIPKSSSISNDESDALGYFVA
jgi:hypothetical protein